jgi:hypothetical protein
LIDRKGIPVARYAPNEEPKSFTEKILELLAEKSTNDEEAKEGHSEKQEI